MYVPTLFAEGRRDILIEWMRRWPFAVVVTADLVASHVPLLIEERQGGIVLVSHLAKANRQWERMQQGGEVVVIFQGPHAYVSPTWYETKPAVPTWNYVAVHAYGTPRVIDDPVETVSVLEKLVATFDPPLAAGGIDRQYIAKLAPGVVAFEISAARIEGKAKLSQNRPETDATRVQEKLSTSPDQDAREIAAMMKDLRHSPAVPSAMKNP